MRAKLSVFDPLVRGFYLKASLEDKKRTWYDFCYEKMSHFCFDFGWLAHADGIAQGRATARGGDAVKRLMLVDPQSHGREEYCGTHHK